MSQFQFVSYTSTSDLARLLPWGLECGEISWYDASAGTSGLLMQRGDCIGDGSELSLSGRRTLPFKQLLCPIDLPLAACRQPKDNRSRSMALVVSFQSWFTTTLVVPYQRLDARCLCLANDVRLSFKLAQASINANFLIDRWEVSFLSTPT